MAGVANTAGPPQQFSSKEAGARNLLVVSRTFYENYGFPFPKENRSWLLVLLALEDLPLSSVPSVPGLEVRIFGSNRFQILKDVEALLEAEPWQRVVTHSPVGDAKEEEIHWMVRALATKWSIPLWVIQAKSARSAEAVPLPEAHLNFTGPFCRLQLLAFALPLFQRLDRRDRKAAPVSEGTKRIR